jgi:hypothetical protein
MPRLRPHWCGIMLELKLNISKIKIPHSCKTNGNTKYTVFISNSALLKHLQNCLLSCILELTNGLCTVRRHLFMVSPDFTLISPWNCSLSSPISSTCEAQVRPSSDDLRRRRNIASIFFNAELHNLETSLSWRSDLPLQTTTQCDSQAASKPLLRHK